MRTLFCVIYASGLLLSMPCWSISNIERQRPGPIPEGVSGQLSLGFNGKTGDKREEDYEVTSRINYKKNDNLYFLIAASQYGSSRSVKDTDETFLHMRWIHTLNQDWAVETFAQWEEDEFSNLISRTLMGGGGRYFLSRKEKVYRLAVGFGGFHENETLDLASYQLGSITWRMNAYYSYSHKINDNLTVSSTLYLQPAIDDFDDLRTLFTLNLSVKMTKKLNLIIGYQAKYDSRPAQNFEVDPIIDKHKVNTEYTTTLNYRF